LEVEKINNNNNPENTQDLVTRLQSEKRYCSFMMTGKTLLLINHLYGLMSGTQEMHKTDTLKDKCRNKIRNKDKNRRKIILKLLKIW